MEVIGMDHIGKQHAALSIDDRAKIIESIFVSIKAQHNLLDAIRDSHNSYSSKIKRNLIVTAFPNSGKTTMCLKYIEAFPQIVTETTNIVPVVYLRTPGVAAVGGLASKILRALGDPAPDKGNIGDKTSRILEAFHDCKTQLTILDEFQHFYPDPDDKLRLYRYKEMINWLKVLIEDATIPFVLVGLPESELALLQSEQLDRRFSRRFRIHPYDWDDVNDREEFISTLTKFDHLLPFSELSGFSLGDMPERFYYATAGVIGYIFDIIRPAADKAIRTGYSFVSRDFLNIAFNENVSNHTKVGDKDVFTKTQFSLNVEDIFKRRNLLRIQNEHAFKATMRNKK